MSEDTVRRNTRFGKDLGLVSEAVVTGRKVGAGSEFWSKLAHDEQLFRSVIEFVENEREIQQTYGMSSHGLMDLIFSFTVHTDLEVPGGLYARAEGREEGTFFADMELLLSAWRALPYLFAFAATREASYWDTAMEMLGTYEGLVEGRLLSDEVLPDTALEILSAIVERPRPGNRAVAVLQLSDMPHQLIESLVLAKAKCSAFTVAQFRLSTLVQFHELSGDDSISEQLKREAVQESVPQEVREQIRLIAITERDYALDSYSLLEDVVEAVAEWAGHKPVLAILRDNSWWEVPEGLPWMVSLPQG